MRSVILVLAAGAVSLALAGCDNRSNVEESDSTSSVNKAPQVDADPTPDTGTGGEQQNAAPDGTVNGAPLGDQNQQHAPKQ